MPRQPETLTVKQLKDILERFPDDLPVMIKQPTGNYWGHILAGCIKHQSDVDIAQINFSLYHHGWKVEEDKPEEDEETMEVLLLGN